MRTQLPRIIVAVLLMGIGSVAMGDNLLKNADLKEGSQLWRGDAQEAFLKPDGTEGEEGDPGVTPVLRISMSRGMRRAVYQEFTMKGAPNHLHVSVQVYASIDFKRSTHAEDYQSDDYMPNADFSFRVVPDYTERTSALKPGAWVTVKEDVPIMQATDGRAIYFFVPPGEGVIYIKNPSVTP